MTDPAPRQNDPMQLNERFARLFAANQQSLYRYILTLVGRTEDAQDILQETSVALMRKIGSYDPELPFLPWARKFAYFEVLKNHERRARAVPMLNGEVLEQVSKEAERYEPVLEARREALDACLDKVPAAQRELLKLRYSENTTVLELADMTGQSVQTLYTQLKRLRAALLDCISRRLRREGMS